MNNLLHLRYIRNIVSRPVTLATVQSIQLRSNRAAPQRRRRPEGNYTAMIVGHRGVYRSAYIVREEDSRFYIIVRMRFVCAFPTAFSRFSGSAAFRETRGHHSIRDPVARGPKSLRMSSVYEIIVYKTSNVGTANRTVKLMTGIEPRDWRVL